MKIPFFIFLLMFFVQSKQLSDTKNPDFIYGNWGICIDSTTDNPPTFLICKHDISFYKDGTYCIFYNDTKVGTGIFLIEIHPNKFKKDFFKINFEDNEENEISLSDYFPNTSIIFKIRGAIVFLDIESYDPATIYFLYKN